MVGRRGVIVLVGLLPPAGTACSLFVSTDDLQGGADAGFDASIDQTTDVRDAAIVDATTDADSAPGPFCATHPGHTFCADFDEDVDAAAGWSASEVKNASYALDDTTFVSPPHSFASLDPATATTSEAEARLALTFAIQPKTVHLEMDANLCDFSDGGTGYAEIFKLAFGNGFNSDGLELQFHVDGSGFVRTDAPAKNYFFDQKVPASTWLHLVMDVVVGSSGSIKVVMNDVNVLDQENIVTNQQTDSGAGYHGAVVGLYSSGTVACTTHIDNVIIDAN